MPEYNDWGVSYSAISFLEKALGSHSKVKSFQRSKDIVFNIELKNGSSVKAVLVNEYSLGLAAVLRALHAFPGVEYIVTCANWNGYTRQAKEFGDQNDLGIFVVGEFLGALHWTHPKKYVLKDKDGNPIYHYKSA